MRPMLGCMNAEPTRESMAAPVPAQQQRNVDAIARVEAAILGERSSGEKLARGLIRRVGTPGSVMLHVVALSAWLLWNATAARAFDLYPFNLLALVASLEAIVLGLLILTSQNRLQHEADRRAHLNLQINMMAEMEGTKVLEMLDRLCRHVGVVGMSAELLDELTAETDPQTIARTVKASMPAEE